MEQELGRPVAAVFSSISEGPIAAASLGQVYKAVLRESGEEVAIKVPLIPTHDGGLSASSPLQQPRAATCSTAAAPIQGAARQGA